ncbi:hypothetical protein D3C78_1247920 [compost metagenome]
MLACAGCRLMNDSRVNGIPPRQNSSRFRQDAIISRIGRLGIRHIRHDYRLHQLGSWIWNCPYSLPIVFRYIGIPIHNITVNVQARLGRHVEEDAAAHIAIRIRTGFIIVVDEIIIALLAAVRGEEAPVVDYVIEHLERETR